jgi:hypothetical protein
MPFFNTPNNYYPNSNPSGFSTYDQLSSLSGTLTGIYATYAQLTGLSGYEASVTSLLATYAQLTGYSGFQDTVNDAFATYAELTGLSGYQASVINLETTGSTLLSLINSLSGVVTGDYATASELATGLSGVAQLAIGYSMSSANAAVSGIAGSIVYKTGNQTISGSKTFSDDAIFQKSGFFASGIKIGNSSIYITEGRIDGGYSASTGSLVEGLLGIQYSGYFDSDPTWFTTASVKPIVNELTLTGVSASGTYTRVSDQLDQGTSYFQGPSGWRINYYSQYPASTSYWYLNPENFVQHYISSDLGAWSLGQNIDTWDGGTSYNINDIVSYDGSIWICKAYAPVGYGPFSGYLDGSLNGTDYWDELPATQTSTITQTQNSENSTIFNVNRALSNDTSWEWVGYFKANNTSDHNFTLNADRDAYFWIGDKAVNNYTTGNADMYSTENNSATLTNLPLTSGIDYPVRMQWGHPINPTNLGLSLSYDNGIQGTSYNFSGLFFNGPFAGKSFYIDAISGNASFGGNINSNTATFNNLPTVSGSPLLTGVNLSAYITSGQTGAFYGTNNPSGFITGVNLSSYITTGQTGAFYSANNPSGFITGVSQFNFNNGGDLSGSLLSPTVTKIQGNPVSNETPVGGQTLQWNGSAWVPGSIPAGGNGGGGRMYYFNFAHTSGIAPTGGLPTTGDFPLSLLGTTYYEGSGQAQSADLDPQNTNQLICGFVSASGNPGVTEIPAGLWDFNIWARVNSASATQSSIKTIVHIYNPTNSTYRKLGESNDIYLYETDTIAQYIANVTVPQTGILATERLYVEIYGKKYTSNERRITLYFDSYRPSHVHTTIPSVAGNGVVKVINGVLQTPATGIFDSDVDNNAAISQSKIANLTGDLANLYPRTNPSGFIPTIGGTGVSNGGNVITGNYSVASIVQLTQSQYNAITPVSTTLYIIV